MDTLASPQESSLTPQPSSSTITTITTSSPKKPPPTFACTRCSERKVKCDRRSPCEACIRFKAMCIYRAPKPSGSRRRRDGTNRLVYERLRRYEALLREKGVDVGQVIVEGEGGGAEKGAVEGVIEGRGEKAKVHVEADGGRRNHPHDPANFQPQLLHGEEGTGLVHNLWSRVAEEIQGPEPVESTYDANGGVTATEGFSYVLGTQADVSCHPPPEFTRLLWQIFKENVNPLTKLIHVPTLQPAIEKAILNIAQIPAGFEALMFAMYSMAILSLTELECTEMIAEPKELLLRRYTTATKAALSRANFMSSTNLVVLQALLLHIFSIRDTAEPRAVWALTGVALRIAEGMGLCLDGTLFNLPPFETEVRRRIWWQLMLHDFRAAELCGQAKFRDWKLDETTPKRPANVDDKDLWPRMERPLEDKGGVSEMMFCVFRTELPVFAARQKERIRKQGKDAFTTDEFAAMHSIKEGLIKELEDAIETKYIRFCDPSDPLQFFTLLWARCATNAVKFMANHPRRWANLQQVPEKERQFVWDICMRLLEQYNMMQSSPQLKRFAWSVPYSINWHVVIHLLDILRANPLHQDAAKAWSIIDRFYEDNWKMLLSGEKPILMAVGSLCLNAFDTRTAATLGGSTSGTMVKIPEYILQLREKRAAAKARKEAVLARNKGEATWLDPQLQPAPAVQQSQHISANQRVQGSMHALDDAFWLNDTLDGVPDMMNLDMDANLAQDYWLETPNDEVIDWEQWDAWLGGVDLARSNIEDGLG